MNYHPSPYSPYPSGWYNGNENYNPNNSNTFIPPTLLHMNHAPTLVYPSTSSSYSHGQQHTSSSSMVHSATTASGFVQYYTEEGLPYYYSAVSGESIWATPHDWVALYDQITGALYYYNHITHESQWAENNNNDDQQNFHQSNYPQTSVLATVAAELPSSPEQEEPLYTPNSRNPRTINASNYTYSEGVPRRMNGTTSSLSSSSTGYSQTPPHRTPFRHYNDIIQNQEDISAPLSPASTVLDTILSWSSSINGGHKESSFSSSLPSEIPSTVASSSHGFIDTESVRTTPSTTLSRFPTTNDKKERRKRAEKAIRESRKQLQLVAFHPHGIDAAKDFPHIEGTNDNLYRNNLDKRSPKKLYDLSPPATDESTDNDSTHSLNTKDQANEVTEEGNIDVITARAPGTRYILPPMMNMHGNDIESDMDITAAQAAEEFVGLTLAERTVWLRKVLLQFGGTFVANAQVLALFLTANSLSFVKKFMNAILTLTKAKQINFRTSQESGNGNNIPTSSTFASEAFDYVRKVTNVAFQQLSPVAELPSSMRSLPSSGIHKDSTIENTGNRIALSAKNRKTSIDTKKYHPSSVDTEYKEDLNSSLYSTRTKAEDEDETAYETCGSTLPTPSQPDHLLSTTKGTDTNHSVSSSVVVPPGSSSLTDLLFSNEAVSSLLRPLQSSVTTLLRSSPPQRPSASASMSSLPLTHSPPKYDDTYDSVSGVEKGEEQPSLSRKSFTDTTNDDDTLPQYSAITNESSSKEIIHSNGKNVSEYKETFDTEEGWVLRPVVATSKEGKIVPSDETIVRSDEYYSYHNTEEKYRSIVSTNVSSNTHGTRKQPSNEITEAKNEDDEESTVSSSTKSLQFSPPSSTTTTDDVLRPDNYLLRNSNVSSSTSNSESMAMLYAHGGTFGFLNNNFSNRT